MKGKTPTIKAEKRERLGSRYAKRERSAGKLPAVIYGHKTDPLSITVSEKELLSILRHGVHLINIDVNGSGTETCLVKDLQFGWLGDNVIHVDFARVNLDEEVHVHVHLRFIGEPSAAKREGALLVHDITELEVVCKANAIPDEIVIDQEKMESVLTIADLKMPEGVRAPQDPTTPIAHISFVQEAGEGEAAELTAEGAQPEVIRREGAEEGEKEGA